MEIIIFTFWEKEWFSKVKCALFIQLIYFSVLLMDKQSTHHTYDSTFDARHTKFSQRCTYLWWWWKCRRFSISLFVSSLSSIGGTSCSLLNLWCWTLETVMTNTCAGRKPESNTLLMGIVLIRKEQLVQQNLDIHWAPFWEGR